MHGERGLSPAKEAGALRREVYGVMAGLTDINTATLVIYRTTLCMRLCEFIERVMHNVCVMDCMRRRQGNKHVVSG